MSVGTPTEITTEPDKLPKSPFMEDDMVSGIYSYNAYPSSRRRERNHYIDARIDQRIRQFESLPFIMTYRAPRTRLRASILVLPMHGSLLRLGRTDSDGRESRLHAA